MRQLKFRGKSVDTNEFVYGYGVVLTPTAGVIINQQANNAMHHWAVEPETIGQYTGKKDLKKVDIYEGDVLLVKPKNANFPIRYLVVFNIIKGALLMRFVGRLSGSAIDKNGFYDENVLSEGHDIFEVIGNMHDSPELIKNN